MAESLLARQYIEYTQKGFDTVQSAIGQLQKGMMESEKSANLLRQAMEAGAYAKASQQFAAINAQLDTLRTQANKIDLQAKFGKVGAAVMQAKTQFDQFSGVATKAVAIVAGTAATAFSILTGSIMGFVRAGLQGTVEGMRLQFAFQQLSREITGVFLPVIDKVTAWVQKLVGWFRSLTGSQQDMIMKFVLIAAAVLAVVSVVGALIIGLIGLTAAILSVAASMAALDMTLAGIPLLIGAIVTAVVGLASALGIAGAAGIAASDRMGTMSRVFDRIGDALAVVWERVKAAGQVFINWMGIIGRVIDIAFRLGEAIMRPFEKMGSGASFLERWADVLDRIGNFMDDYIVPAFEVIGAIIENTIVAAIQVVESVMKSIRDATGEWYETLRKISPLMMAIDYFYNHTRASANQPGKDHRRPTQYNPGFESALDYAKRLQAAALKPIEKKAEEETAKNTAEMDKKLLQIIRWIERQTKTGGNVREILKTAAFAGVPGLIGLGLRNLGAES